MSKHWYIQGYLIAVGTFMLCIFCAVMAMAPQVYWVTRLLLGIYLVINIFSFVRTLFMLADTGWWPGRGK